MSADPNKKSPRTFQCRDALWENFEQLARELECSVDYLVNEAMKQYARQRASSRTPLPTTNRPNEGSEAGPPPAVPPAPLPARAAPPAVRTVAGTGRMPAIRATAPPPLPPPPASTAAPLPPLPNPPPARAPQGYAPPTAYAQQTPAPGSRPPPPPARTVPPPTAPQRVPTPPPAPAAVPAPNPYANPGYAAPQSTGLSIIYQGERFSVNKERFIIGRGKQSSDLTLKDPNVSRQHAMVEYHSGIYFMVDMGSTNGVEYNGQRIARKQIGEGDTFRICDHEVVFTFR